MERAVRRLLIGMLVAAMAFAPMLAVAGGVAGLGSSQPNQVDVSTNPQFHVYEWVRNSVLYVQVNDAAGNVQFAVATGGGEVLVLPIGSPDAVQVLASSANTDGTVVYSDSNILIRQVTGGYAVSAAPAAPASSPATVQTMAICSNPSDCSQALPSPTH